MNSTHDDPRLPRTRPGVLLPATHRPAERQRPHGGVVPGHVPPPAPFFTECRGRALTTLTLADLDAPAVLAFLDHLEQQRGNSIRTRNVRLAALRSFLKYAAARDPTCLPVVQRVLAIPMKRFQRPLLGYLSREEMAAILVAPDGSTWSGQRDRVLFALMYNTGARVSEAIGLRRADVALSRGPYGAMRRNGRNQRLPSRGAPPTDCRRNCLPWIGHEPHPPWPPTAPADSLAVPCRE